MLVHWKLQLIPVVTMTPWLDVPADLFFNELPHTEWIEAKKHGPGLSFTGTHGLGQDSLSLERMGWARALFQWNGGLGLGAFSTDF